MSKAGQVIADGSPQTDREVLLQLKVFLQQNNPANQGPYALWGKTEPSPCSWSGITCDDADSRVTGISLSSSGICGSIFGNFSALTQLSVLDLSNNALGGAIPSDLSRCKNLRFLNLSINILAGELSLNGLSKLEILDVAENRFQGELQPHFPTICRQLIVANISSNNLSGGIVNCFDRCWRLQVLDLSENHFKGPLWPGLVRLRKFSVSENNLTGELSPSLFAENCSLQALDLSVNDFHGRLPNSLSNCNSLVVLNLFANRFRFRIPPEIGNLPRLEVLNLARNHISREIPEALLNCRNLSLLNLGRNGFGGDIQDIFGRFVQVEFLVLYGNSYTGGLISSGILTLPNVIHLDVSCNWLSGHLPVEISKMSSLKSLIFGGNRFNGIVPPQFGELSSLLVLDLSSNNLTGAIPSTIGNLTSLMWLMLAQNKLTGAVPREIGNCSSLLWLNLANNRFIGEIPVELTTIGRKYPSRAFESQNLWSSLPPGDCLVLRRWIPANYPPFSFVYSLLSLKHCRSLWGRVLRGTGLFPIFGVPSDMGKSVISGYLQLTGNRFSGDLPQEIGEMQNFSLFLIGFNRFTGSLPSALGRLPLVILNVSNNGFSGAIPSELGYMTNLQNLDLSRNNFSGEFPSSSLGRLNELSKFNVSYNPSIFGMVPTTGQLATFDDDAFLGCPKLNRGHGNPGVSPRNSGEEANRSHFGGWNTTDSSPSPQMYLIFLVSALSFLFFAIVSFIISTVLGLPNICLRLLSTSVG
ncbi:hypothetical protein ACLOJK_000813 [Asimina triloba]